MIAYDESKIGVTKSSTKMILKKSKNEKLELLVYEELWWLCAVYPYVSSAYLNAKNSDKEAGRLDDNAPIQPLRISENSIYE